MALDSLNVFSVSLMCVSRGVWTPPPPEKNHKNIGFLSITGLDPLQKAQNYQASIQCWAIIVTPAKRRLIGVLLAGP